MARKRARSAKDDKPRHGLVHRVLTADLVLRAGSYALRHAVSKGLVRGKAAGAVSSTPPSIGTRVLTAAASAVATRSVPGAVLVGTGIVVRALYRRGKARRQEKLGALPPN